MNVLLRSPVFNPFLDTATFPTSIFLRMRQLRVRSPVDWHIQTALLPVPGWASDSPYTLVSLFRAVLHSAPNLRIAFFLDVGERQPTGTTIPQRTLGPRMQLYVVWWLPHVVVDWTRKVSLVSTQKLSDTSLMCLVNCQAQQWANCVAAVNGLRSRGYTTRELIPQLARICRRQRQQCWDCGRVHEANFWRTSEQRVLPFSCIHPADRDTEYCSPHPKPEGVEVLL